MVVRRTVLVCVLAVLAYFGLWAVFSTDDAPAPVSVDSLFLTDYSKARAGDCVRFDGPGENDQGLSSIDCSAPRAALRVGAVLSSTSGDCPRGDYKVLRDSRHNAALCLMPNAREGDCFEMNTDDLQRSVVSKFDCTAPRVNVQVVGFATQNCPEEAELGVPYGDQTLCLRRVR